jgi:hypothetical protein
MRLQLERAWTRLAALAGALLAALPARGAVLPEERADALYHYYDGGGTQVDGPALLVRKNFAEKASLYAGYYADVISGASIDVVTTASPYKETRTEYTLGADYLYRNTTMGLSVTTSDERDYQASSVGLSVAHEIFDDLTTINLGYSVGHDTVGKTDTAFSEPLNRHQYQLGVSQVFTKTFVMSLNYEAILEDGFLNSPYRAARLQGLLVPEAYPRTRDSYAIAVRGIKGLIDEDGRVYSSIRVGYRSFWDTWDIKADTIEFAYVTRPIARWTFEPRYRYYKQSAASFYSDNFQTAMTFMARDKELATFTSNTIGLKAAYDLGQSRYGFSRAAFTIAADLLLFEYRDFTDVRTGERYSFDAVVFQVYFSGWF